MLQRPSAIDSKCVIAERSFGQATAAELQAWRHLGSRNDTLDVPFFAPQVSSAVHAVGGDVRVAVVPSRDVIVGVLPFHRIGRVAYPGGRFFNDGHNIIADAGTLVDRCAILKQLRLRSFDVHALAGGDTHTVEQFRLASEHSVCAELGDDPNAFLRRLFKSHKTISRQPQKTRELAREIGDVRLEIACRDPERLDQLIRWKRSQYARTNILDLFKADWTTKLLAHLHARPEPRLPGLDAVSEGGSPTISGPLSVLWAGDQPVAAHFGLLEHGRLHCWFHAYDVDYAKYSPGTALFREIIEAASVAGIQAIDMGYGEQPYKRKQTDTIAEVGKGCISRCMFHRSRAAIRNAGASLLKRIPMKEQAKVVVRSIRPDAGIGKLR